MQLHFLCCENEHEIPSLANIRTRSRLRRQTLPGKRGARLRLRTALWLPACSPLLPLALPHGLAALLAGHMALQERLGIPRDPAGSEPGALPPVRSWERQVKSENKALDATACSTVCHTQNRADEPVNKSLQRHCRAWKSLPISRKSN